MPLRHLKRVRVQFNPLDPRSTAAREFLARVTTAKAAKSNPECAVEPRVRNDAAPPVVAVEFASGARDIVHGHAMDVKLIARRIKTVSDQMAVKQSLAEAGLKLEDLRFDVRGT